MKRIHAIKKLLKLNKSVIMLDIIQERIIIDKIIGPAKAKSKKKSHE